MVEISVVIPVYRAADCLNELYARLKSSLESVTTDFEILLVEDSGPDKSWELIRALSKKDPRVKGIHLSRNFGQHYAITAGLDHCQGKWVVVMDCDLQDPPEEIPRLYRKAIEGYDIVLALRNVRKDKFFKKLIAKIFYFTFSYLTDIPFRDRVRNYRILSHKVILAYRELREQMRFFPVLVDWLGFKKTEIDGQHEERKHGKSSYTLSKLWKLGLDTIIANTDKPLRIAITIGFVVSFFAFAAGIFLLTGSFLFGFAVTGWASLMISFYFLSGLIIAILGVNGLYLGKAFNEVKKRPLYVIEERVGL